MIDCSGYGYGRPVDKHELAVSYVRSRLIYVDEPGQLLQDLELQFSRPGELHSFVQPYLNVFEVLESKQSVVGLNKAIETDDSDSQLVYRCEHFHEEQLHTRSTEQQVIFNSWPRSVSQGLRLPLTEFLIVASRSIGTLAVKVAWPPAWPASRSSSAVA